MTDRGTVCAGLGAFIDGELSEADTRAFRDHLHDCALCSAGLQSGLQLAALAEAARRKLAEQEPPMAPTAGYRYASAGYRRTLPRRTMARIWVQARVLAALEWAGFLEPDCFCTYGTYHGGDPRDFRPDEDQLEELKRHAQDCGAWALAEALGHPPPEARDLAHRVGAAAVGAFVQIGTYGYGTKLCELHGRTPPPVKPLLRWRRAALAWWRAR
jgi:hypothetical protein